MLIKQFGIYGPKTHLARTGQKEKKIFAIHSMGNEMATKDKQIIKKWSPLKCVTKRTQTAIVIFDKKEIALNFLSTDKLK